MRLLGAKLHTLAATLSTALANLLFASSSSALAFGSVAFCAAEDCMSAAVMARLMQVGATAGIGCGQLAHRAARRGPFLSLLRSFLGAVGWRRAATTSPPSRGSSRCTPLASSPLASGPRRDTTPFHDHGFETGKLFAVGVRIGRPQLPYFVCAATQLLAALLVLVIPRAGWEEDGDGRGRPGVAKR